MTTQDTSNNVNNSSTATNDSTSTASTAFAISFEDDANKKLNIKDSLRQFVPPKLTIKTNQSSNKSDSCQDSLLSIESAPPMMKSSNESTRNNQTMHEGISDSASTKLSDSAAFLIDKMLCSEKHNSLSDNSKYSNKNCNTKRRYHANDEKNSNSLDLNDEFDYCDDRSDNGTYVVGADPESEAARQKIGELFGVDQVGSSQSKTRQSTPTVTGTRSSRPREISTRLSRLAIVVDRTTTEGKLDNVPYRSSSVSRNSSKSRHDKTNGIIYQQNKPRNPSCDRSKNYSSNHSRRSLSQSSRQSTENSREPSEDGLKDNNITTSHKNLSNSLAGLDNSVNSHPSMKFNRAFALRRARLGVNDSRSSISTGVFESQIDSDNLSQNTRQSQTTTTNFNREDGGRFSLRMKASSNQRSVLTYRTQTNLGNSSLGNNKSYMTANQVTSLPQNTSPRHNYSNPIANRTFSDYGNDEERQSSMRSRLSASGRFSRQRVRADIPDHRQDRSYELEHNRMSSSFANSRFLENDCLSSYSPCESTSRCGKRENGTPLGALDSLVISAISTLSLKIRHSVCDILMEQARKLPSENETRSIVEEILPQLTSTPSSTKSPTSIEEIDKSLYFDLAKTLKNLKKVEQMVDVIKYITHQIPPSFSNQPDEQDSNEQLCESQEDEDRQELNCESGDINDYRMATS